MSRNSAFERRGLLVGWIALAVAVSCRVSPARVASGATDRELAADDLKAVTWRSVGPANMGGRVSSIALLPGSRRTFYVGFGTGGVFKTENLGVTFSTVFDEYGVLSVGAIAVADAPGGEKEKGEIVWVGTGEGNGRNSSSWGKGVVRSTDAGKSFVHLGLEETHDIPALALDPRDPDVCYVAALGHLWGTNPERGVFKTTDGGKTWEHVLGVDERTGACDVAIDPKNPDTVYAALYARLRTPWSFTGIGETGGIFRSDDAGKNWKKLANGLPSRTGRIGLAIFTKDPRVLDAVVESDEGGAGRSPFDDRSSSGGLFRSQDRGETWTRTSDLNFRAFYFSRVAVDPEDESRVYLPGWDLAISDDGGRTFRRSGSENVHVDQHAIVVNPADPTQILLGTDGGIYVSHDRAATWDFLDRVAVGQFYRVAVDMSDPYRIGGGLQDNGSWVGPSETLAQTYDESKDGILNSDWGMVFGGDGFGVAFDPSDRNVVYATRQGGDLARIRLDDNVRRFLKASPREGQERLRFNWNAPFLVSRHDPTVLYHGANKVLKLTERGNSWAVISADLSRAEPGRIDAVGSGAETYGTIVALAESPLRQGFLWAGTDDGRVHVTEDEGKTWTEVTPPEVGGLYVSRIEPSAHDERRAYLSVDGHRSDVFRPILLATDDLGRTWRGVAGDLPEGGPVKVVIEDPFNPEVLYCGTEFGCFATVDRGARWVRLNGKSLPPAPVDDLVLHPRERDLVAGTHGRSLWILDDASFLAELTPEVRDRPLALLEPRPAKPRLYAQRDYGAGHGLFRAKNPPMGAILDYWVREDRGENVTISIADPSGFVIRKLEGPGRRGLNRVVWDLQADRKHVFPSVDETEVGMTPFVPAGDYEVTISMGRDEDRMKVTVLPAPNEKR